VKLSEELQWRGFYNQTTFESPSSLDEQGFTLYLGTDPTADSLHVGHLAVYMMVRRFLDRGHRVILLVGGGTGVIGDPGGRTDERSLLSLDQVADNTTALAAQVSKLFSGQEFQLVNNYDWLKDINILEFLRDVGKHFSMTQLTQRDYIAKRIGEGGTGISYAEFSYTLLQGYDYLHLHRTEGVNLQIGGSDQWGNIISGVELIRKVTGNTAHAMTAPLVINKSTGRKFGKSEGGAVWLDESKTSVYKFYQFWLNTDDESAIDYLKLFSLLDKSEIDQIESEHKASPAQRLAQRRLAEEVTALVHGQDRLESVARVTDVLFGRTDIESLSELDLNELSSEIPSIQAGFTLVESLVESGLVASNGEARRLIKSGAISRDGQKLTEDIVINKLSLIKKGKNSFLLVR